MSDNKLNVEDSLKSVQQDKQEIDDLYELISVYFPNYQFNITLSNIAGGKYIEIKSRKKGNKTNLFQYLAEDWTSYEITYNYRYNGEYQYHLFLTWLITILGNKSVVQALHDKRASPTVLYFDALKNTVEYQKHLSAFKAGNKTELQNIANFIENFEIFTTLTQRFVQKFGSSINNQWVDLGGKPESYRSGKYYLCYPLSPDNFFKPKEQFLCQLSLQMKEDNPRAYRRHVGNLSLQTEGMMVLQKFLKNSGIPESAIQLKKHDSKNVSYIEVSLLHLKNAFCLEKLNSTNSDDFEKDNKVKADNGDSKANSDNEFIADNEKSKTNSNDALYGPPPLILTKTSSTSNKLRDNTPDFKDSAAKNLLSQ